jgi:hypothetical protein
MPIIPALDKLRQEDCELEVNLGYTVRPVSKRKKKKNGDSASKVPCHSKSYV